MLSKLWNAVGLVLVGGAVYMAIQSRNEVKRYLKIKKM